MSNDNLREKMDFPIGISDDGKLYPLENTKSEKKKKMTSTKLKKAIRKTQKQKP
ncbi:MAG: hypothetical protein ACRC78_03115 [Planktothrix sp.]